MKCEFCDEPATVHVTNIIHKKKREVHLCEGCAREKQIIPEAAQEINVPALLQMVLGQLPAPTRVDPDETSCTDCGITYAQFRAQGRLGCPNDYEEFRAQLEPLLERVHCGRTRHLGKIPGRRRKVLGKARRVELEAALRTAISSERYEDAARIRDQIKALGTDDAHR
jgi:protein arginine kinase activator